MKILINLTLFACLLVSNANSCAESLPDKIATAIFAGGCFWCMEPAYDALPGVISTTSGYSGGQVENPTYEDVSNGTTGHSEVVQVTYSPTLISYEKLLEVFWRNIDPFDNEGQFCDKGNQYKAIIFYGNDREKQVAEASKQAIAAKFSNQQVVTEIKPSGKLYPAENYHQNYYLINPKRYKFYRYACGRDKRLSEIWGEAH